jgi:hypothetical protein
VPTLYLSLGLLFIFAVCFGLATAALAALVLQLAPNERGTTTVLATTIYAASAMSVALDGLGLAPP